MRKQLAFGSGVVKLANTIQCGDSAFLLRQIPDASVDLLVTSPPYYMQRHYNMAGMTVGNEGCVDEYVDSLMEVFTEAVRVVKPTGSLVYNIGDKYVECSLLLVPFRFAIEATKKNSVRLVNNITWVKANPTPRQFTRRLVSSTEPFFHFAKTSDYYYDRNSFFEKKIPNNSHKPTGRLGEAYREKIENSDMSREQKENANIALDEVIAEVHAGEIQSFRMKIKGVHAEAFGGQEGGRKIQMERNGFTIIRLHGNSMKRDVMESPVESIPGLRHCAVFPQAIIQEVIKLLCPPGGIVLDPYMGSGTTALAAISEGRDFIGIDIDPDYCGIARERIEQCRKGVQRQEGQRQENAQYREDEQCWINF